MKDSLNIKSFFKSGREFRQTRPRRGCKTCGLSGDIDMKQCRRASDPGPTHIQSVSARKFYRRLILNSRFHSLFLPGMA